jgi:hypothetical protein
MASYDPPSGYVSGTYNSSYYASETSSTITQSDLEATYLQRTGAPTSTASVTTLSGQIATLLSTNGSSSGGSIITSGGIQSTLDYYTGSGNLTTSSTTGNLFNSNATTINIGGSGTSVNIGSSSGTCAINNSTLSVPNASTSTMGNSSGACTINSSTMSLPNASYLSLAGCLNLASTKTISSGGTGWLGGDIVFCQPLQGTSLKVVYIICEASQASTTTDWVVRYTFPTAFTKITSSGTGKYSNAFPNSNNDTNSTLVLTTSSATITVTKATTSYNSWFIIGY